MPKTIKNCFYKSITFEKFLLAHNRAKKHKGYKDEIIKFEFNLENNLYNLMNSITNNTYSLGNYFSFKVYEPKERTIKALPYKDRIVHQWYIEEFIKPYIIPKFINTSYACLTSRYYPSAMGVNFCGYRIFPTYRLLRNDSKKKIKKKVKKWNLLYKNGKLDFDKTYQSLKSWEGHISHCDSYRLKQKILNSCNFLYNTPNTNKKIEKNFESLF